VPHNTWHKLGESSFISLQQLPDGKIEATGSMKILDFALHSLIALIFKLEYQVPYKTVDNVEKVQTFVLGECLYIPQLTDNH